MPRDVHSAIITPLSRGWAQPTGAQAPGRETVAPWGLSASLRQQGTGYTEQSLKGPGRVIIPKRREGWCLHLNFSLEVLVHEANLPFEGVPKSRLILISSITQQVLIHHVCLLLNLQSHVMNLIPLTGFHSVRVTFPGCTG